MEWIDAKKEPKEDTRLERPCIVWCWDKDVRIGFVWDELAYWVGGRWVDKNEVPLSTHPDHSFTFYCLVPKAKSRKSPLG